jgi:hypothetical protein
MICLSKNMNRWFYIFELIIENTSMNHFHNFSIHLCQSRTPCTRGSDRFQHEFQENKRSLKRISWERWTSFKLIGLRISTEAEYQPMNSTDPWMELQHGIDETTLWGLSIWKISVLKIPPNHIYLTPLAGSLTKLLSSDSNLMQHSQLTIDEH